MKLSPFPAGTVTPISSLSAAHELSDMEQTRPQSVSTGTDFARPSSEGQNKGFV